MEYNGIEELLNKYLEGESSLEEEVLLKEYFSQASLPDERKEMQQLFLYFAFAEKESAPAPGITGELNRLIENEWKTENIRRFRKVMAWVAGAAAMVIISFGTYQYINKPEALVKDTFKDPKLAYLETKRVLLLVSRSMNQNTKKLKYLSKVDESFAHLQKFAQIDKVVNSVKNQEK